MPTPAESLAALHAILPWWVLALAWCGVPLAGALIGLVMAWCVDLCNRPDLEGLHWTERARRHAPGTKLVELTGVMHGAVTGALTYTSSTGVLIHAGALQRAFAAGLFVWAVCTIVEYRRAKWLSPKLRAMDFLRGQVFWWIVYVPILGVAILMAAFGPGELGVGSLVVHGGGVLLFAWIVHGGGIPLGRLFGVVHPADERLEKLVDEVATERGHRPRRVWLARAPFANVIAFPFTNELLFTDLATRELSDDELRALARIEHGRLVGPMGGFARRFMNASLFLVVGLWNPIVTYLGVVWFVALFLASLVLVLRSTRTTHQTTDTADASAAGPAGESDAADYARAIERIHEIGLTPVVTSARIKPMPDLYDRLTAIGIEPDYPRPEPPATAAKARVLVAILTLGILTAEVLLIESLITDARTSETRAAIAIGATGGQLFAITAFGDAREATAPAHAIVCYEVATQHSGYPLYPARLASLLVDRDNQRARTVLDEIDRRLEHRDPADVGPDARTMIDDARKRLGLPPRDW